LGNIELYFPQGYLLYLKQGTYKQRIKVNQLLEIVDLYIEYNSTKDYQKSKYLNLWGKFGFIKLASMSCLTHTTWVMPCFSSIESWKRGWIITGNRAQIIFIMMNEENRSSLQYLTLHSSWIGPKKQAWENFLNHDIRFSFSKSRKRDHETWNIL